MISLLKQPIAVAAVSTPAAAPARRVFPDPGGLPVLREFPAHRVLLALRDRKAFPVPPGLRVL